MADRKNEPQSYGSQQEWVSGETGESVNRQKGNPNSQHGDFYESRHDGESSAPSKGGEVSAQQLADSEQPTGPARDAHTPTQKVTDKESGAKRGSYFKDRDYS